MTLKVVDRFTTRDGKWEVDDRPYGLTKEALAKYGGWNIPGKGGAAHLFVYAPGITTVEFATTDGANNSWVMTDKNGWCNFNLWKSSAYWPPSLGPWNVRINGVVVATGLGLPEGLHVSTFLIVEDVDEGSQQPPMGNPVSHIQVIVDGLMVFDNWSDK